jgi:hypothetical protein
MTTIGHAKNGSPIGLSNSVYLNSRYDPEAEASKFIELTVEDSDPAIVVIVGETLGYLAKEMETRSPDCRCIQVFLDPYLFDHAFYRTAAAWQPESAMSLGDFLSRSVGELELLGMVVVEWEPSLRAFGTQAERARRDLKRVIEIHHGSIGTTAHFGRRWLRNCVHNYLELDTVAPFGQGHGTLVVAAAGPTLEHALPTLRSMRSLYRLWALPSAIEPLMAGGVLPDLVILTDPGYYSLLHLEGLRHRRVPVAMPLTAVRGASRFASELVLLHQGSYVESLFLASTPQPHTRVPPNGTVAGTALQLASSWLGPVVFSGLDFAPQDIKTHARPNAFEPIIEGGAARTSPTHSRHYARAFRSSLESDSGVSPLTTYAAWFSQAASTSPVSLYRLNPSEVVILGMTGLSHDDFALLCLSAPGEPPERTPEESFSVSMANRRKRNRVASDVIRRLRDDIHELTHKETIDQRLFTADGPDSLVYYLAAGELLRFLKTGERRFFAEACNGAIAALNALERDVDGLAR